MFSKKKGKGGKKDKPSDSSSSSSLKKVQGADGRLLIKIMVSPTRSKVLPVQPSDKVRDLIEVARKKMKLPEDERMLLFWKPKDDVDMYLPLENDMELKKYELRSGTHLYLKPSVDLPPLAQILLSNWEEDVLRLVNDLPADFVDDDTGLTVVHATAGKPFPSALAAALSHCNSKTAAVADKAGRFPLHHAAAQGKLDMVIKLLSAQSKVGLTNADSEGNTPLHLFCASPYEFNTDEEDEWQGVLQSLADRICPLTYNKLGNTALHLLARSGQGDALRFFATEYRLPMTIRGKNGDTLLHAAAVSGDENLIRYLISQGVEYYVQNNAGVWPFELAPSAFSKKMLGQVVRDGMDVLDVMSDPTRGGELKDLLSEKSEEAESDDEDGVQSGRQMNRRLFGRILLFAVSLLEKSTLEMLLEHPLADLSACSSYGRHLFHIAAQASFFENAISERYYPVFDLLLEKGSELNTKDTDHYTPLHLASMCGHRSFVKWAHMQNAFTNCVNNKGESELHAAVYSGNKHVVNQLCQQGADLNLDSAHAETPLELAQRLRQSKAVDILQTMAKQQGSGRKGTASQSATSPNVAVLTVTGVDIGLFENTDEWNYFVYAVHTGPKKQLRKISELLSLAKIGTEEHSFTFSIDHSPAVVFEIRIRPVNSPSTPNREQLLPPKKHSAADEPAARLRSASNSSFSDGAGARGSRSTIGGGQVNFVETLVVESKVLGRATFHLKPLQKEHQEILPITNMDGKTGSVTVSAQYNIASAEDVIKVNKSYSSIDIMRNVKAAKKYTSTKRIGLAKAALGYRPKYPIIIVPGLASSALEAWTTEKGAWRRERVWVDPMKIGNLAVMEKIFTMPKISKKDSREAKEGSSKGKSREAGSGEEEEVRRFWLKHMTTAKDGYSDPPGIKIRPVDGLHGCDFLADSPLAKKASYVFGHVIAALSDVGYEPRNMDAAPYDWRLPPEKMDERDHYFLRLKHKVSAFREANGEKVVLMGHSMGCRNVQYFLWWLDDKYPGFADENIHAFMAMGPPFLGATKSVRAVISGDCLGLEAFLTEEEGLQMSRGSGSLPWLFPILEQQLPDCVARYRVRHTAGKLSRKPTAASTSVLKLDKKADLAYDEHGTHSFLREHAKRSMGFYHDFYEPNPYFLKKNEARGDAPVFLPPPVKNLWTIIGVNLNTEVSYYFKKEKHDKIVLDQSAERYSGKKHGVVNPRGLTISGGIAFETKHTFQPTIGAPKSGDGTVPFCSLNYPMHWAEIVKREELDMNIQVFEVDGAEHREMLDNEAVFDAIMELVCERVF
mmetsp:Transcript_19419/g.54554  ORF Transcript_19419/g.54554 Transcript_19419/m.54554 type:complete len:1295 (+) Transcript_19419:74-3958(+)